MKQKAIFLDRDGTINVEKNYLYRIEEFEFLPNVITALKKLQDEGFLLIIITNQSGIARGYYSEDDYNILNNWMLENLRSQGIIISAVYYCPHHPEATIHKYRKDCSCRKPKTGLFVRAIKDYDLDLNNCFTIGDKIRDCSICENSNCHGFLIGDNEKKCIINEVKTGNIKNVQYASNLLEAAKMIIASHRI